MYETITALALLLHPPWCSLLGKQGPSCSSYQALLPMLWLCWQSIDTMCAEELLVQTWRWRLSHKLQQLPSSSRRQYEHTP